MIKVHLNGEYYSSIRTERDLAPLIAIGDAPAAAYTLDFDDIKAQAEDKIATYAEAAGERLVAGLTPRRVAEYSTKAAIAANPDTASADELALLDREAAALGMDRAALLTRISKRAAAYRQITLLIATMEAEAYTALDAIENGAGAQAEIDALLVQLQAAGERAIADVRKRSQD